MTQIIGDGKLIQIFFGIVSNERKDHEVGDRIKADKFMVNLDGIQSVVGAL